MIRKPTKEIKIGNVTIGNNNPIAIQSMTNTLTKDIKETIAQIHELQELGCEIVRVSVPDEESVNALKEIKQNINIPLVADIHFDYKLAIEAAKYADKLRINPGNIGNEEKIKEVINAAKENNIPIRIGVNLGSLEKDLEKEFGLTPKAMLESVKRQIAIFEKNDFHNIVVALKTSDIKKTIEVNRMFAKEYNYPIHLGITEAGSQFSGTIKSSIGIGTLLQEGIGDTIRVSLSAPSNEEVKVAKQILSSLKIRKFGIEITSCPTCARTNIDIIKTTKELEKLTEKSKTPISIAVMGCAVNGPGEAKEADLGIVGGKDECLLYKKGEIIGKVKHSEIIDKILSNIEPELKPEFIEKIKQIQKQKSFHVNNFTKRYNP